MNGNGAPVCPINRSQATSPAWMRSPLQPATRLPVVPIATDLPSLIRSVNIALDVLRSITTSLTVNNTWETRIPPTPSQTKYKTSPYPEWMQGASDTVKGYVYHRDQDGVDKDQRVSVIRTNSVEFYNMYTRGDYDSEILVWRYVRPLDA